MKTRLVSLPLFLFLLFSAAAPRLSAAGPEPEKTNIAVADFAGRNIAVQDAAIFSDLLRTNLVQEGHYNVLDKANMDKLLGELSFQQTGATDSAYAARLGKLLNVEKMVVGTVSRLDGTYYVNASIVGVESGKIERSEVLTGRTTNDLMNMAGELAARLSGDATPSRRSADRGKKFAVGAGNPFLTLSYDFARHYSVELRYAAELTPTDDKIQIYGARCYYGCRGEKLGWYAALDGGTISFQGYGRTSALKGRNGYMAGLFAGGTYAVTPGLVFMLDFGPSYINLDGGKAAGIELIVNTGVRFYLF
jgi:hypothetical protein